MEEEQKGEFFQTPSQFESSRTSRTGSSNSAKKYFVIIFAIVVLLLIIFGISKFIGGSNNSEVEPTPAPTEIVFPTEEPSPTLEAETTPTEEPTKSPTPKPTVNAVDKSSGLDRSKLSVQILNGSGTAGASKKASDLLEGLGYNVIQIGNADNFDYEKTVIQVKSASSSYLPLLQKDLSGTYAIGSTSANLASSNQSSAVVIVGKQ